MGRIKDPNLTGKPEVPKKQIDYYQMESTYAGRIHKNKEIAKGDFFRSIRKAPGKVLVPTFSMQRTQEILIMLLEKAQESISFSKEIHAMKKDKSKLKNLLLNSKLSEKRRNEIEAKIDQLERHIDLITPELFDYEIVLDSPLSQKISQVYITNK
jgi:Cft2 family RNA processing exonuclease